MGNARGCRIIEVSNIRNLAKGSFGAAGENDRALPNGDVARDCEGLLRFVFVAAAEREQAWPRRR